MQAERIIDGTSSLSRIDRVIGIVNRYQRNLRRAVGENGRFISNKNYDRQVSRGQYMGLSNG